MHTNINKRQPELRLNSEEQGQDYYSSIEAAKLQHPKIESFGIVYRIYCKKTGACYVGKTNQLWFKQGEKPKRILDHYRLLKRGKHNCEPLQSAWNASRGGSIADELVEVVPLGESSVKDTGEFKQKEKYWQEKFKAQYFCKPKYYPLTTQDILNLKAHRLINNTTLVYLALKLKNPWCDRPIKIDPLQLSLEWDIPESSVYEAIAKLKAQELIEIEQGEITICWTTKTPELFQDSRTDYEIPESILENQNEFQDSRMNSRTPENNSLKPLSDKGSNTPHTISYSSSFSDSLLNEQPEREKSSKLQPGSKLKSLASLLPSNEDTRATREISDRGQSSAPCPLSPEENSETEFLNWVIAKVKQFPRPPIFPKQVAIALIKRSGAELKAEYKDYLDRRAQSTLPPSPLTPLAPTFPLSPFPSKPSSIDEIFARLNAKWNLKCQISKMRKQVEQELQQHPEWNIKINGDCLELLPC